MTEPRCEALAIPGALLDEMSQLVKVEEHPAWEDVILSPHPGACEEVKGFR
ncbi:MAG: hypothetical protein HYZ81_18455 [Nitrospinae bacterium]|nr:hypothetical protein [Nitrospinota bacterium]